MPVTQAEAPPGALLEAEAIHEALASGLSGRFTGLRLLVLIPDYTRSAPVAELVNHLVQILHDVQKLDFMVALGTHLPLSQERLHALVGLTARQTSRIAAPIGLFNHRWTDPDAMVQVGRITQSRLRAIAGEHWHPSLGGDVPVQVNRAAIEHDHILVVGPTFPHEVAGFSGGAKYLFPGISGPEVIHVMHWLGALVGALDTMGVRDTPVRAMIHAAVEQIPTPISLVSLVADGDGLAGVFVGDVVDAWETSTALSAQRHILYYDKPFQSVLSCAPAMYDELWTAAKAMYKIDPVVADGGEIMIFAPHLRELSRAHGEQIRAIGYHVIEYFLKQWDHYKHVPLGVLAHSTHLRGAGRYAGGVEFPRVRVTLASRIPPEECANLNLGYQDPDHIDVAAWQNREHQARLFVPKAGERLYRLGSRPD